MARGRHQSWSTAGARIAFLSAAALISSAGPALAGATSLWRLDGQNILVRAEGAFRTMTYEESPAGAGDVAVPLLFLGTRSGNTVEGFARIWREGCDAFEYHVLGTIEREDIIVLKGAAPIVSGGSCSVEGASPDAPGSTLELHYVRRLEETGDEAEAEASIPGLLARNVHEVEGIGTAIVESLGGDETYGPVSRWTGLNARVACRSGRVVTLLDVDKDYADDKGEPTYANRACDLERSYIDKPSRLVVEKMIYDPEHGCLPAKETKQPPAEHEAPLTFDLAGVCK